MPKKSVAWRPCNGASNRRRNRYWPRGARASAEKRVKEKVAVVVKVAGRDSDVEVLNKAEWLEVKRWM